MFEVGFSEIAMIAVVALLVLGPERLPKAARTVGALLRRARNSWQNVKSEIEREIAADELKRSFDETIHRADVGSHLAKTADELRAVATGAPTGTTSAAPSDERV